MEVPSTGWANTIDSQQPQCSCGTWKRHWLSVTGQEWPSSCSIQDCANPAEEGGQIHHPDVQGDKVVPLCGECKAKTGPLVFSSGVSIVCASGAESCLDPS